MMNRSQITLKPNQERRILSGHPWVFSNEIHMDRGQSLAAGDLVDLFSSRGRFLGTAYYHPGTLIACRILSRNRQDPDQGFFRSRIRAALHFRERIYNAANDLRLIFSESDNLPGLVVDRYGRWLAVQVLTAGMDRLKETALNALEDELRPDGIVLRGDTAYRALEGLSEEREIRRSPSGEAAVGPAGAPLISIEQHGLRFLVDILNGQKTGFYYDQRENRDMLARWLRPGHTVLDLCCYTGAWSILAASLGASRTVGVDSSADALSLARENASLNGLSDRTEWVRGDVLHVIDDLAAVGNRFDLVVLDPPALAKSRRSLRQAGEKYRRLNAAAMGLVSRGGFLVTCSCSHLMGREAFWKVLGAAAAKAGRYLRLVAWGGQAFDHPVLVAAAETEYLHCAVAQVN